MYHYIPLAGGTFLGTSTFLGTGVGAGAIISASD